MSRDEALAEAVRWVRHGRQALGFVELLLELSVVPELHDHLVEAPDELSHLVAPVLGKGLGEVPVGHAAGRLDHLGDRPRVAGREVEGRNGAQREDDDGGGDPLRVVRADEGAEVVEQHYDVDVSDLFVPHDDREDDVVALLRLPADVLPERGLDDQLGLRGDLLAHVPRIGARDNLFVGRGDDGYLLDPLGADLRDVLLEGVAVDGPALRQTLDGDLDRPGEVVRVGCHLADELGLARHVDERKGRERENGENEKDEEKFGLKAQIDAHGSSAPRCVRTL